MVFTGLTYRYFTNVQQLSFAFSNIQMSALDVYSGNNPNVLSGQYTRLGFTGIHANTGWAFKLINGRIYDPENRFFGSFNDTDTFTLSGNISTGSYSYYLNGVQICTVGKKSNFDINGWFVECVSGASGKGDISIYGLNITGTLTFDPFFYVGGTWTGRFTHTNNGPVVLRSGLLSLIDGSSFSINTGFSFLSGTNVVASGGTATGILTHTGNQDRSGLYIVGVNVYTDFGPIYFLVTGNSSFGTSGYVSNSFTPTGQQNIIALDHNSSGTGNWYFFTSSTDSSGNLQNVPFYASLIYSGGYTGLFSLITGFAITNSGAGYTSQPTVYVYTVAPNAIVSGYPTATGSGILSGTGLSGIQWINTGIYTGNTGNYRLFISGGGATLTGSGVPLFGLSYTKSFISGFNLLTGVVGSGGSFTAKSATIFSGSGILNPPDASIFIQVTYSGTLDTTGINIKIVTSGLPDSASGFSQYTGSGLSYTSTTL